MADKAGPAPEGGWESLKVDELKAELEARGLPKSGKKQELIERLADDDVAQAGTTPEPAAEISEPAVSEVAGGPATEDSDEAQDLGRVLHVLAADEVEHLTHLVRRDADVLGDRPGARALVRLHSGAVGH